jgi:hypothetical protein
MIFEVILGKFLFVPFKHPMATHVTARTPKITTIILLLLFILHIYILKLKKLLNNYIQGSNNAMEKD